MNMTGRFFAKVNNNKLCSCPSSESGKVKIDTDKHLSGCRFWKRSRSRHFGIKTAATPNEIVDGCSLGVVLREGF